MSHEYPDFPDPRRPIPDPETEKTYFQEQTPQEYLDQTTQKYSQLHTSYTVFTKKEQIVQLTGMIFILLSFSIELIVYFMVQRILPLFRPDLIWKLSYIFIVLFVITFLAIIQFVIIYRWNRSMDRASSTSLTRVNYRLVDQIRTMIILVSIILFFCLVYFYLYNQYRLPPPDQVGPIFRRLIGQYRALLSISWILITGYFLLEIWQIFRWIRRNSAVRRLERKIIGEIPNFNELADLADFADDS
jgi:hypothetical protein